MTFSENLKRLREERSLTQAKLAELVGVTQPTIAQYEMGIKLPTIIVGVKLAEQLDTTCEELIGKAAPAPTYRND